MKPLLPDPLSDTHSARGGRDRWLLSYGDFMTLLLALFVVLYASAQSDADRSQNLVEGIQSAFKFASPPPLIAQPIPMDMARASQADGETPLEAAPLLILEDEIRAALESDENTIGEKSGASLHRNERGLVLSLASAEFFPEGGVAIPPERRAALATLAPFLAAHSGSLHFEGHTDAQPIASQDYPSNWELSTARAAAVARLFIQDHDIDPLRVATTGYAEFRPIAGPNEQDQQARNRRVEIVILADGELVVDQDATSGTTELDRLLDVLPPLPNEADASLKAESLGPPPPDIPLP
ncbi:MAG: flagellar motor protein MotB [Myxococcota bacterium]